MEIGVKWPLSAPPPVICLLAFLVLVLDVGSADRLIVDNKILTQIMVMWDRTTFEAPGPDYNSPEPWPIAGTYFNIPWVDVRLVLCRDLDRCSCAAHIHNKHFLNRLISLLVMHFANKHSRSARLKHFANKRPVTALAPACSPSTSFPLHHALTVPSCSPSCSTFLLRLSAPFLLWGAGDETEANVGGD
jgi:hypothetical protein